MTRPYFYPRSPCGERQGTQLTVADVYKISIHALLAESDYAKQEFQMGFANFYPRSPCGERLGIIGKMKNGFNFYPRSPCGERQKNIDDDFASVIISIHALLAESDSNVPFEL